MPSNFKNQLQGLIGCMHIEGHSSEQIAESVITLVARELRKTEVFQYCYFKNIEDSKETVAGIALVLDRAAQHLEGR